MPIGPGRCGANRSWAKTDLPAAEYFPARGRDGLGLQRGTRSKTSLTVASIGAKHPLRMLALKLGDPPAARARESLPRHAHKSLTIKCATWRWFVRPGVTPWTVSRAGLGGLSWLPSGSAPYSRFLPSASSVGFSVESCGRTRVAPQ